MANLDVRVVNNVIKVYPDMIKIIIYKEPQIYTSKKTDKRELKDNDNYTPTVSSLNRTKTLVKDITLCNDFELFCTFTFDPKKVDSFNLHACWGKMSRWLHHQNDNSHLIGKDFKYLIIPEQHKSGRWHFHALILGYTGSLNPSKHKTSTNRPIYNITSFRSGFTTAVYIDSKEAVSNYVTKYITKDFVKTFNQRRFFCSRDLVRPEKYINSSLFNNILPLFKRKVAENQYCVEYVAMKSVDF